MFLPWDPLPAETCLFLCDGLQSPESEKAGVVLKDWKA